MAGFSQRLTIGLAFFALGGCGSAQPPKGTPAPENSPGAQEQLSRLVDRYWDEHIQAASVISPQVLADSLAVERRYLSELAGVSRPALDVNSRLTYDIFKRRRETLVEGFTYPSELMPLDSFGGVLQSFEILSADSSQHPWSVAEYENWLKRLGEYVAWTQQAIQNMREGLRRGYVSPRLVIAHSIELLEHSAEDTPANAFRAPLRSLPASIGESDRARLKNQITTAVDAQLLPANLALRDFLQHDYLARGRSSVALTDLPLGDKWYAFRIKRATDSPLTAAEIHAIGVAEVERLKAHLPPAHESSPGTAPSAAELLGAYQALIPQVAAAMLPVFAEPPSTPLEVRGTLWLADPQRALLYIPEGLLGKPAAVLYVNIGAPMLHAASATHLSVASFLQEALPGHHLQSILAHERLDLPRFRRMEQDAGFVQGWDLYAQSLGEQLGLLTDDAAKTEALMQQLRCAVGLVVDTGLHAQGWTPKQALAYVRSELAIDDAGAQSLLDWYAANPADALACKMGELKIAALRTKAQQILGNRFDIRAFHAEILKDGAMPLDILEAKMKIWMEAAR
jgi:uncharacterized protein (DUF885 family)